jgi:hypothetical protein
MRTPQKLDQRSLELHRLIARKLRDHPELFPLVEQTLLRWKGMVSPRTLPYVERWSEIVSQGLDATLEMATADSEEARALRQSAPFAGILSHKERFEFFRNWRWDR